MAVRLAFPHFRPSRLEAGYGLCYNARNRSTDHLKEGLLESIDLARAIVTQLEDVKGEDIVLLDLRDVTGIADYFVICSSDNQRQLKALADRVYENIKRDYGLFPRSQEGGRSGWTLLDYNDVVVHIFSEELRSYYDLEGFWKDAKVLLRIQ